jgi:para-aminobenzoate synthetase component 1
MTGMSLHRHPLSYHCDVASRLARLVDRPWFVYLDSCRERAHGGRYDIVACDPIATVVTHGATTTVTDAQGERRSEEDPFHVLDRELAARLPPVAADGPFCGGALGYFAYDLARRLERLPERAEHDIALPEMAVGLYGWAIVVDHEHRTAEIVVHPQADCDLARITSAWTSQPPLTPAAFGSSFTVTAAVRPEISFEEYATAWRRIKHYIREGDVYQVNLTQRFSAPAHGHPWDAYLRLRNLNPAPYSAYFALPDGAVLSSSPERFLRVDGRRVETKPIKGTRPRGATPEADAALATELESSAKDRAENVMIVDLLRNDLGRSCVPGSVRVPKLFAIESYTKVHHLVSTVEGVLADGLGPLDALRNCFPGGSITGAPKLRAMEIIEEIEPARRSVYCGSIGYVSASGHMDTNIAIRTLVCHRERMYCWAGGGIVMDSDLDAEYAECLAKAAAMLEVFQRAEVTDVGREDRR